MRLPKLFDELDYNLDEMVKYFEIVFPVQPIDVPDATRKIRKVASFRGTEKLSRVIILIGRYFINLWRYRLVVLT
jgi:hypothetical protein